MAQIGNVQDIRSVKNHLNELKAKGWVKEWEIPYEEILTRLTAAIFFLTPVEESMLEKIWNELTEHKMLQYRINQDKSLSKLEWRVEFNKNFMLV